MKEVQSKLLKHLQEAGKCIFKFYNNKTMRNYQCQSVQHYYKVIQSQAVYCPSGNNHLCIDLGECGDKNYQCRKCGTLVKSKSNPSSSHCPLGNNHTWTM